MKGCTARLYDDDMRKSQALRNEIVNGMEEAMETVSLSYSGRDICPLWGSLSASLMAE